MILIQLLKNRNFMSIFMESDLIRSHYILREYKIQPHLPQAN